MKKKIIYISAFVILLITLLISIFVNKNDNIIMQDGHMLVLTLDGNPTSTFPDYNTGNYTVKITCDDGVKAKFFPVRESVNKEYKVFIEETSKKVKCNIDFKAKINADVLKTIVETEGTSGIGSIVYEEVDGAGYRYEGQDPNNYVWFNNELWRIIGSIPVCLTSGCGNSTTNLVKIIRNSSIGSVAYDGKSSNFTGVWGSNTLYNLLNTYYYGLSTREKNATGTEYCNGLIRSSITKSKCNYNAIGIDSNGYYGQMIEKVYWNTGKAHCGYTALDAYRSEKSKQTIYNYIGLLTLSDYGYATGGDHSFNLNSNSSRLLENWLAGQGYEWTSIQNSLKTEEANNVIYDGSMNYAPANFPRGVRPVVYLKDSVYVVMGDGTITNPYILAI